MSELGERCSLGEHGFDSLRFAWVTPDTARPKLGDVSPLLLHIADKTRVSVHALPHVVVDELVRVCAGGTVRLKRDKRSKDTIAVSLRNKKLTLNPSLDCGLRDLIFAAVLLRVHADAGAPGDYDLTALLNETSARLVEELPQAIQYSSAAADSCRRQHNRADSDQTHEPDAEPGISFKVA